MNIKLFESKYGSPNVMVCKDDGTCWADNDSDYIALSESIEVDFVMLPAEEVTAKQIDALENAKAEAHAKWLTVAARFDDRISKLRAIPHISNSDES